jgi:probable phosphoglycerate mutase
MHLFLIRHGESETNANWQDIRENHEMNALLTARGHQQAKDSAEWMRVKVPHLDALYASTLNRTRETVKYFEDAYHMQAEFDDRIREGGYCYRTGVPIEDDLLPIKKTVDFHRNPYEPFALEPPGVESYSDMRQRVGSFLQDLIRRHAEGQSGQVVCVVMHGWTLNVFTDLVFNVPQHRATYVYVDNTSLTYYEYVHPNRIGPWRVHFLGATPHMEVFDGGFTYEEKEA